MKEQFPMSRLVRFCPPSEDEEFKFDELPGVQPNSRLSCRISRDLNLTD